MTASCGLNKIVTLDITRGGHGGGSANVFECSRIVAAGGGARGRLWSNLD
jgi:hypothetical protein